VLALPVLYLLLMTLRPVVLLLGGTATLLRNLPP
jgi:hypothetical protein